MKRLAIVFIVLLFQCGERPAANINFPAPTVPASASAADWPDNLDQATYYDKVLGMLVGSAIGDAMGAPVEMWSRKQMEIEYGFIDTLLYVFREGSPEGPWEDNLSAGATTDDTRWKYLMGQYLLSQTADSLDDIAFAQHIMDTYQVEMTQMQQVDTYDPEPIERELMHMTWLQEWAKVARPFVRQDLRQYSYYLNRFYGGEMACAGLLYTPVIGSMYPGQPNKAYLEAYRLGIFDLGYARDISALSSSYVAQAMNPNSTFSAIGEVTKTVDPLRYFNSRLIGRLSHQTYSQVRTMQFEIDRLSDADIPEKFTVMKGFKGTRLDYFRLTTAYEWLDSQLQHIPFHAGEIHLINLMALEYSKGDFRTAMTFITNYGRDNDTVAALSGAILGAYHGYDRLPAGLAKQTLNTSRELMGMDLEVLARKLTNKAFGK
jgi:hypothetical protein